MADGTIKNTDPRGYLGHFRSEKVIKAGHNVGPLRNSMGGMVTGTPSAPTGGPGFGYKPKMTKESGGGFGTPAPAIADAGGTMKPPSGTGGSRVMTPKPTGMSSVKMAKQAVGAAKKTGGDVGAAKAGVKEAKQGRTSAYKAFNTAKSAFTEGGYGGGRGKALKEARQNLRQNYAGSFKKTQAEARAKKDKGGFFSKMLDIGKKASGASVMKKAGGKMMGAAKKMGGKAKSMGKM